MNVYEHNKMQKEQNAYWWHIGKRHLIKTLHRYYVSQKNPLNIFEIGCGSGETLKSIEHLGNTFGLDISKQAIKSCQEKGISNLFLGEFMQIDLLDQHNKHDLILSLDVLEHIQEDHNALKKIYKLLKPGGFVFITVPAYKFLWSTHDEALHHKRRYHSLEINTKVRDAGFELVKSTHFVSTFFIPIAFFRLLSNFVRKSAYPKSHYFILPPFINNFFVKILEFEAWLIKKIWLPVGTTIVVVAKKPF